MEEQRQHFLVVTFPVQGHLNPGRHLAKRLALLAAGARITISTPISGHRRMFSSISTPDEEVQDGNITYIPFSDGDDDGSSSRNFKSYVTDLELLGSQHLAAIIRRLSDGGQPVTCVIYTLLLPWAGRVAREHGITSVQFWIQPATILAICYHFFHGHQSIVSAHSNDPTFRLNLPNLPTLQIRDLPTFLTITDRDNPNFHFLSAFKDTIEAMKAGEKVLVNTFDELEPDAFGLMREHMDLVAIGPVMPPAQADASDSTPVTRDLFGEDGSRYMEWLNTQRERSVVYASFGSNLVLKKGQMEGIRRGLMESGRPYLWAVRREPSEIAVPDKEAAEPKTGEKGMEIEWCAQLRVLSHAALGCFVTHCGWNSTAESLVSGVPVVAVGRWADQATNAWMVEREWGVGVRAEVGKDGEVEAEEVRSCIEMVMGDGERGLQIRRKAAMWKERAREAIGEGGSSDRNLRAFIQAIQNS
ncbi:Cyanidin 3-O-rutinoside 5-O-glucosyltransferase [Platanthera zijinensis]|uniref:Cyanidin 3-O-rutinoside 5-O-glucosyltransferase n=1 Tax=Platanthera zijinensis TaxID=2320716 RepID=A0AAP0ASP4_9ASPA